MINNITLAEISQRIEKASCLWIVTHRRPDGDAVGSAFGLMAAIQATMKEKEICLLCADEIPDRLTFLCPGTEFSTTLPFTRPDLVISVDIAASKLLGDLESELCERIDIKIDHHESGDDFAPRAYIDPRAAAAGQIIAQLFALFPEVIDQEKALLARNALYGAIAADTGGFRYSNTTPDTHRIAADLMEGGADAAKISHALFESKSAAEINAIRAGYQSLTLHHGGKIATILITAEMMRNAHLQEDDLGILSSLPREIAGVELGIVLRQSLKYPDTFKISMRSGEKVNVCELCSHFGGGGHVRAAGGEIKAQSPDEALQRVLALALKAF